MVQSWDKRPCVKYLMREEKKRFGLERVCKSLLTPKAKPLSPKQSVKFKCQMWFKITKMYV